MDILCKHIYIPTTIITDLGTQFNAQVTHEIAAVLGIELKHAAMKHAQKKGLLERTHALVKTHLKAASGEFRNNWHKYLPLPVHNHNRQTMHQSVVNLHESSMVGYHTIFSTINLDIFLIQDINRKLTLPKKFKSE